MAERDDAIVFFVEKNIFMLESFCQTNMVEIFLAICVVWGQTYIYYVDRFFPL